MIKRHIVLLAGLLFTATLVVIGCSFKNPGIPIWSIEVSIPFSERTYKLSELISDSTNLSEDGYGIFYGDSGTILQFVYLDTLEYQSLEGELNHQPSDTGDYTNRLGTISIEAPLPDTTSISASRMRPGLNYPYTGPLVAYNFSDLQDTVSFELFNWVRINSGWLKLSVYNDYPFDISDLTITLVNLDDLTIVGEIEIEGVIPSHSMASDSTSLAGKLMRNTILMETNGTVAADDNEVRIIGNENLWTFVSITETDSANAMIESQGFETEDSLELDDPNRIIEAKIKSGWTYFELENSSPLRGQSTAIFDNIIDVNGQPLISSINLQPGSTSNPWMKLDSLDLAGSTIHMDIDHQYIFVKSSIITEDSRVTLYQGSPYQTVTRYQGVKYKYWITELIYEEITGIIDSITVEIPEHLTSVDLPSGLDSIEFTADTLFIDINNEINVPVKLDISLLGINYETGQSVAIPINDNIYPGDNRIIVPDGDQLTSILPDVITFSGVAGIGTFFFPELTDSIISINDSAGISGTIQLKSDLMFILGETEMKSDPVLLDLDLDFTIERAAIHVKLVNSIPIAGTVYITMGLDTLNLDTITSVAIPQPEIIDHRVAEAVVDTFTIFLDSTEFDLIRLPDVYTSQIIKLTGSDNQEIWLFGEDSLVVQANAWIRYMVDPGDNFEDESEY